MCMLFAMSNMLYSKESVVSEFNLNLQDEQGKISGTVVDASGFEIPGVTVIEVGTGNGTITDMNGKYSLNLTTSNPSVSFSSVGFMTQTITVGTQQVINVTMSINAY